MEALQIIKPILLVDDISRESVFSTQRSHVLRQFSIFLASRMNCWIQALHVDDPSEFSIREPHFKKYLKAIFSINKESFYQVSKDQKILIQFTVREGDTTEEILKISDAIHAKLIVTGTYARAGLRRFILGSVTEEILNRIHIPTIIFGPKALKRKLNSPNHQQNRILVVTGLDDFQRAEAVARTLARSLDSQVLIIEKTIEKSFFNRFKSRKSIQEEVLATDKRRLQLHQLQISFKKAGIETVMAELNSIGTFKKKLLDYSLDNEVDLIVISRAHRSILHSLILQSEAPVLSV